MLSYRKAEMEDCRGAHRLVCELERVELPYARFARVYAAQLRDGRYRCLVCEEAGELAGMLNFRLEDQLHHAGKVAEILEFCVSEARRGRGIGRELLRRACEEARACGCERIEAACNRDRSAAHRFYRREGMRDSHLRFELRLDAGAFAEPPGEGRDF